MVSGLDERGIIFVSFTTLRVRYSETDRMGTFYNSRALEWFECGRTELLRQLGMPYSYLENCGVYLPVVEAHIEYLGRAKYDDLLKIKTSMSFCGKARAKMEVEIFHFDTEKPVVRGYTIHAFTNKDGKPIKPPQFFIEKIEEILQRK